MKMLHINYVPIVVCHMLFLGDYQTSRLEEKPEAYNVFIFPWRT